MKTLKYHTTHPYPCGYLPDKMARSEIVAPEHAIDTQTFAELMRQGYRRSGRFVYRPQCDQCHACLSVRINVDTFAPSRSQRRSWEKHQHLTARQNNLYFDKTHFELYQRYQSRRHSGGSMEQDNQGQYQNFLLQSHVDSCLVTFHENAHLRMISIIDELPEGLSSVYTFYDPDIGHASFGTYSILWQIQLCRALDMKYLYLGYWIRAHHKMNYKANFQPLEILIDRQWIPFEQFADIVR